MGKTTAICSTCNQEVTAHNKTGYYLEDITLKARAVTGVIKHRMTEHKDILKLKDYVQFAYAFIVAWLITIVFVVFGAVMLLVINTLHLLFTLAPVILVVTIAMLIYNEL